MIVIRRQIESVAPLPRVFARPPNLASREAGCPPILSPPRDCAAHDTSQPIRTFPPSARQGRKRFLLSTPDPAPGSGRRAREGVAELPHPLTVAGVLLAAELRTQR